MVEGHPIVVAAMLLRDGLKSFGGKMSEKFQVVSSKITVARQVVKALATVDPPIVATWARCGRDTS